MSCAIPVPDGVAAADAASSFVNPLTALGMTETMRLEGHSAIVHTAAASNLGQMLNRLCQADGIPLVNVVRRNEQADLLRAAGAEHVVVSSADSFADDLTAAITATGATLAFDAIGGGEQVDTLLPNGESLVGRAGVQSLRLRHPQTGLHLRRARSVGHDTAAHLRHVVGCGGMAPHPFLGRVGFERMAELQARVAAEITTTFASGYADTISLDDMLDPAVAKAYSAQATGEKAPGYAMSAVVI